MSLLAINKNRSAVITLIVVLLFVAANAIFVAYEHYWFTLLPVGLLIIGLYFVSLDKIFFLVVFLTPLSITLSDYESMIGLAIPTEPLMAGVLLVFIFKLLYDNPVSRSFLQHRVTIVIILGLVWMLITSVTSEIPLVSFKQFIARLWFVVPFYFLAVLIFRNASNMRLFLWLFLIPMAGTIVYTTLMHATYGFDGDVAHWVMSPFYNDHTAYGAVIAMFAPISVYFVFDKSYSRLQRIISGLFAIIVITGLVLSVSRAAWLSVVAALGIFFIIHFRIKFRWIFLGLAVTLGLFFVFQRSIIQKLEKNKQDSEVTDFAKHAQSISNISTDASNLERLNRWAAAFRMFKERPLHGWGPGTYQFVYAPFQHSKDLTIISTNAGDKGNAHSEYFGPLCEQGVPGMLFMVLLLIMVIITAVKVIHASVDKRFKHLIIAVFLGLITYYFHGILNNFLDTDKASVPFWGFTAMIVAAELYHIQEKSTVEKITKEAQD